MLRVRDIVLDPPLLLAPMEGVTDLSFRRLVRSIGGCGLTVTEFIPGQQLADGHRKALEMARFDPGERPVSVQVYGRDPHALADAARFVQDDLGADMVDLNMGCPSKKVCRNSGGSGLMREPEVARRIVAAMRAAVHIPLTVKMRAGWDPEHRNAPELAKMCAEEGVEMVVVHWRTRTDLYGGVRELHTIAAVKDAVSIPVIANGDIVDAPSALDTLAQTGCDGLMIGRGAIRDPWVFRKIEAALHGDPTVQVDLRERERVLLSFYETLRQRSGSERHALGRMKKIARYFADGVPQGAVLKQALLHSQSVPELFDRVQAHFEQLRVASDAAMEGGEAAALG